MAIKAKFLTGVTTIKIDPLHQWDYGQQLEIESEDAFPTVVEVHFSCLGMNEAEVRVCDTNTEGIAIVAIPDSCLEQTGYITAWIYEIDGTAGKTTKSITIPMIARARPGRPTEITPAVSDCYTELIGKVNEAVGSMDATIKELEVGNITVKNAENAENAENAKKAELATHAATAGAAETASVAQLAEYSKISMSYVTLAGKYSGRDMVAQFGFPSHNFKCTYIAEVVNAIKEIVGTYKNIPATGYVQSSSAETLSTLDLISGVCVPSDENVLEFKVMSASAGAYTLRTSALSDKSVTIHMA